MVNSAEVQKRKDLLENKLEAAISHYTLCSKVDYWDHSNLNANRTVGERRCWYWWDIRQTNSAADRCFSAHSWNNRSCRNNNEIPG